MEDPLSELSRRSTTERLVPQEEMLEVAPRKARFSIGVPKEISPEETRVALVPDGVGMLAGEGLRVLVEAGAGLTAHFTDHEYSEAGAQVVYSPREVFEADLILKVAPLSAGEIEFFRPRQTLISALQVAVQKEAYFRALMNRKVNALAYELIRDKSGSFPVVRAMSEIAGCTSVILAADYLASPEFGRGKMFGGFTGISPSEVVIIGAGTVGEYSARSALGLGAQVKVFDNSVYRLSRLQNNLGARIFTSVIHPRVLLESMKTADVVIGAVHSQGGKSPCMITREMIGQMKNGAVIIDVSIDQGGCFETSRPTTHSNPVFIERGITHYCVPNIASRVPHTASQALNNIIVPVVLNISSEGGVEHMIKKDWGVRQGVFLYNGISTNLAISKLFNLPFQDIELLMAAYR